MKDDLRTKGRFAGLLLALSALVLGGLIGAATPGRAATAFTVDLRPLIGTTNLNDIPQVTFGGKIGYRLFVENTGDSNSTHASIVVTSDLATFLDSDNGACVQGSTARQMVCTPPGGGLAAGDTFAVNFRFTAPSSGAQVSTIASLTIAAKTVGAKNNGGTSLTSSQPVLTNLAANGAKNDTFLRQNEDAATGNLSLAHPQNFGVQLPPALIGNPFGVALSIHDELGSICTGCLGSHTELAIPAASRVSLLGNPFFDGMTVNPYRWSMSAQYAQGFTLTRVVHIDNNNVSHNVPSCASIGGPTAGDPLCWDTLTQVRSKKIASATGRGLENGKIGFG